MNEIGRLIKLERIKRGLSCAKLGKMAGTSAATISRIENAKRGASTKATIKVCKALDIHEDNIEEEPKIQVVDNTRLLPSIEYAIATSNLDAPYVIGFRNGLRYAKYLIDGKTPQYESIDYDEVVKEKNNGVH